jgi:membrane-bound lytic murein transglycosylase B
MSHTPLHTAATRHSLLRLAVLSLTAVLCTLHAVAQPADFATWLQVLRAEAVQLGISEKTLHTALTGLQPLARVVELDRRQPETTLTYTQYIQRVLSSGRMQRGKQLFETHRALLTEIAATYGVQPPFIVALWGMETDYGRSTGDFSVLAALATLAYDGRRSEFFRREFLEALKIVDEGHITPKAMLGSWAGAMGQNQFMPSSFRQYAVDYNGDGRRDIWGTLPDIFASTANYLARSGWHTGESWGCRATVPGSVGPAHAGLEVRKSLPDWHALGVQSSCPGPQTQQASLILPEGPGGPAFLVYDNFHTILKWNRSTYFALAVGQLADAVGEKG